MKFFKQNKEPLISDDGLEVPEESTQENAESSSDQSGQPKTETAIVKSILVKSTLDRLNELELYRGDIEYKSGTPKEIIDDVREEISRLRYFKDRVESIPDVLYQVCRSSHNEKVLEIKGIDGSFFELSLSRRVIGGKIYQLKDTEFDQTVELLGDDYEYDYLDKVERTCINGYLIPDNKMSEALDQLGKRH